MFWKKCGQFVLALTLGVLAFSPDPLWAHGGHKHDGPKLKLPEVVARVGERDIQKESIWPEFKTVVGLYLTKGMPLTLDQEKKAAKKLLDKEISKALILQKGDALGIKITSDQIDKRFNEVKASFKSEAAFKAALSKQSLTQDGYKGELEFDLLQDAIIKREIEPNIKITGADAKEYYEKNIDTFQIPEKTRISVILIKTSGRASTEDDLKAKAKAESIRDQIAGGTGFADLAKRYSQDSLRSRGGDMGFLEEKRMFPPFRKWALEKLKKGEISEVFKTKYGYHILKVTDKKSASSVSLEEAENKIKDILKRKESSSRVKSYIDGLRNNASVKFYF